MVLRQLLTEEMRQVGLDSADKKPVRLSCEILCDATVMPIPFGAPNISKLLV